MFGHGALYTALFGLGALSTVLFGLGALCTVLFGLGALCSVLFGVWSWYTARPGWLIYKKKNKKTDHMSSRKKLLYFCDSIRFYLGSF